MNEANMPLFIGKTESPVLVCPECGYIISKGISKETIVDLISYCPKCGSFLYLDK